MKVTYDPKTDSLTVILKEGIAVVRRARKSALARYPRRLAPSPRRAQDRVSDDGMTGAIWQISAGPAARTYAEVFLQHGVALIGPGDAGPWTPERDDDEFEGGFVRRFASAVAAGDVFLRRTGVATIAAVGLVTGDYLYVNAFDDVNGWDLQHGLQELGLAEALRIHEGGPSATSN